MSPKTLLHYWLFDRDAVERIIESRGALLLGGVFVLSAAFAREYDGADLLREPWHLAIPFGASLVASLVLYGFLATPARVSGAGDLDFLRRYPAFLGLFWMTAPLA